jgi:hypothetical protein
MDESREEIQKKLELIKKWDKKSNSFEKISIGKAAEWLVDCTKEAGLDIDGLEHIITNQFKSHVLNEHGDPEKERLRGQIAVNEDDFEKLLDIIDKPDRAIIGVKRSGKDVIYYIKKMDDGTIFYLEEIINSKNNQWLLSKTMFKRKRDISDYKLIKIISMNNRTNVSKARIVNPVGTGSNPSCVRQKP